MGSLACMNCSVCLLQFSEGNLSHAESHSILCGFIGDFWLSRYHTKQTRHSSKDLHIVLLKTVLACRLVEAAISTTVLPGKLEAAAEQFHSLCTGSICCAT